MKQRRFSWPLLLIILCFATQSGCQSAQSNPDCLPASSSSQTLSCLIKRAENDLSQVQDPFAWSSSAAELALAHEAAGNSDRAISLLAQAIEAAISIDSQKQKGAALSEALVAMAHQQRSPRINALAANVVRSSADLPPNKRSELLAKQLVVAARHGDFEASIKKILALPEDDVAANYKAVALRVVANQLAERGKLEHAQHIGEQVTMSLTYYQSTVRSDLAAHAITWGDVARTETLLAEALPIANAQDNGYFVAAALRDIAYVHYLQAQSEIADDLITAALAAAEKADTQNEKARAVSRIATSLANVKRYDQTRSILEKAIQLANDVESDTMRAYTYYEIAGSAAFSGQFDLAQALLKHIPDNPFGSALSLRDAAIRDLAWGLTRFGNIDKAINESARIQSPRERIQAYSRMARLLINPDSKSLPRYL